MLNAKTHEQKKELTRELKSKMLGKILETVSHSEIRNMVGFRGGAVLHFAYSSPRYTNDLDFVWLQSNSFENREKIISILSEKKLEVEGFLMNFNVKKNNEDAFRLSYTIDTFEKGFTPTFVVESTDKYFTTLEMIKYNTSKGFVLIEKAEDILLDKIIASVNRYKERGSIKNSDVFDMFYLSNKKYTLSAKKLIENGLKYGICSEEMIHLLDKVYLHINQNKDTIWDDVKSQLNFPLIDYIKGNDIFYFTHNILKHSRNLIMSGLQLEIF